MLNLNRPNSIKNSFTEVRSTARNFEIYTFINHTFKHQQRIELRHFLLKYFISVCKTLKFVINKITIK